jgi:hypothetical protein
MRRRLIIKKKLAIQRRARRAKTYREAERSPVVGNGPIDFADDPRDRHLLNLAVVGAGIKHN